MSSPTPPFICGLDAALRLVGAKWKPLVLHFLARGPMRYSELKRSVVRATDKVLIQQLRDLEAHGIVVRTDYQEVPPRVDYALTPLGASLAEALRPLCAWGDAHGPEISEALSK